MSLFYRRALTLAVLFSLITVVTIRARNSHADSVASEALRRDWHLRSDSTSGGHEKLTDDRRYQQRSGSSHLRHSGLRNRR